MLGQGGSAHPHYMQAYAYADQAVLHEDGPSSDSEDTDEDDLYGLPPVREGPER